MATKDVKNWLLNFLDDSRALIEIISDCSPSDPVVIKPKTNVELAEEILTKHGYCLVHLVKKTLIEDSYARLGKRLACALCDREEAIRWKLATEKVEAARQIEIEFALNVMRERTICKKKEQANG